MTVTAYLLPTFDNLFPDRVVIKADDLTVVSTSGKVHPIVKDENDNYMVTVLHQTKVGNSVSTTYHVEKVDDRREQR